MSNIKTLTLYHQSRSPLFRLSFVLIFRDIYSSSNIDLVLFPLVISLHEIPAMFVTHNTIVCKGKGGGGRENRDENENNKLGGGAYSIQLLILFVAVCLQAQHICFCPEILIEIVTEFHIFSIKTYI